MRTANIFPVLLLAAIAGCAEGTEPQRDAGPEPDVTVLPPIIATGTAPEYRSEAGAPLASRIHGPIDPPLPHPPAKARAARAVIEALYDMGAATAAATPGERFIQINARSCERDWYGPPCIFARYVEFDSPEAEALWRRGNEIWRNDKTFVTLPLSAFPQELMDVLRSEGIEIAALKVLRCPRGSPGKLWPCSRAK